MTDLISKLIQCIIVDWFMRAVWEQSARVEDYEGDHCHNEVGRFGCDGVQGLYQRGRLDLVRYIKCVWLIAKKGCMNTAQLLCMNTAQLLWLHLQFVGKSLL